MSLRVLLVALVISATAAFVVGVSIERGNEPTQHAASEAAASSDEHQEAGGEGEQDAEGESAEGTTNTEEPHAELRPLGVDVEAWPFVAVAALDVREVFHQADINENGLAVLAGGVAALHLAAAAAAAAVASHSRRPVAPSAGPAGTMAA